MKLSHETKDNIKAEVQALLLSDKSGHDIKHIERVVGLAMAFAENEKADSDIVWLASMLHEVDDYKLFGRLAAESLTNANNILNSYGFDEGIKFRVIDIVKTMGYNKYLQGIRPSTLEGRIVSDADMCDAIGATGILRTHAYALSRGDEFFNRSIAPVLVEITADRYQSQKESHSAQHFFDKLLKIPSILMTESGKREGEKRLAVMVDFLSRLFREENAKEWLSYLEDFEQVNKLTDKS